MRTLIQISLLALFVLPVHAQLPTSDLDHFDRSDSDDLGTTPTSPTSLQWSEQGEETGSGTSLTAGETVRIDSKSALLQSGAKNGQKWATVDMSNVSGYPTTLDDASGTVTWAFNMRQNRSNPQGFSSGEHGLMFVLAASSNDVPGSANAYAVVLGQDGSSDALKLVSFNGGYSKEGDFQEIATWSTDLDTGYLSVRVTFDADSKGWTLYAEKGANSYPHSDPRNVTTQRGFAEDATLTGDQQKYLGLLWNHGEDDTAKAFFDDIYVTDPNGSLPVELTTFDARVDGGAVHLRWTTASETRNAGFKVQHATDNSFETLGFVDGAGTTTEKTRYTYTAEGLKPGRHAFRLKQVDLDGTATLGPKRIVTIRPERLHLATTGRNPIRGGQTSFRLTANSTQTVRVTLHDVLGRTLRTLYEGPVGPEGEELTVSVRSLPNGMYFVRARGESGTVTRRVTVAQ